MLRVFPCNAFTLLLMLPPGCIFLYKALHYVRKEVCQEVALLPQVTIIWITEEQMELEKAFAGVCPSTTYLKVE